MAVSDTLPSEMSLIRRTSDLVKQKVNRLLAHSDDPIEALNYSYQQQVEALQQVRRSVADVVISEKKLELRRAQLQQTQVALEVQARQAVKHSQDDVARLALTRSQAAQAQLDELSRQIAGLQDQEQSLLLTVQTVQAKVDAFRTQKDSLAAEYSAAEASTRIGEAVTGISEHAADVHVMVDRARDKTAQLQARATAIDQLVATGTLDEVGGAPPALASDTAAVESRLQALKQHLGPGAVPDALQPATSVVRIQGGNQYRLQEGDRRRLDLYDAELMAAVESGGEPEFKAKLQEVLEFVKSHGRQLASGELEGSELVLPADDMTLAEALAMLGGDAPTSAD